MQILGQVKLELYILLLLFLLLFVSSESSTENPLTGKKAKKSSKCGVFDAFQVVPENATNFIGGSFALHEPDCSKLISTAVQDIVAFQWVFSHWNHHQPKSKSKVGLYLGDSCQRPKEAVSQTLRFLDSVDFYDPQECQKKKSSDKMLGVVLPKERDSTLAVGGIIQSSKIMAGAYSSESAEILKQNTNMVVTSPMLYDYIMAFSQLMEQMQSDLLILVICQEEDPRVSEITRILVENNIHISEIINVKHEFFAEILAATESKVLLYLQCPKKANEPELRDLNAKPMTIVTLGLDSDSVHVPFLLKEAKEITIRQSYVEIPAFKPYFFKLIQDNYDGYALTADYVQELLNCSLSKKTCPKITTELIEEAYKQSPQVDSVVRLAYAFAVIGRYVEEDKQLKSLCKTSSNDCARAILHQLTLIKFVREEHGLLELANAELGFFLKTDNIAQSVGLKLQVTVAGGDQIFTYHIADEPKISQYSPVSSLGFPRSICQPYYPFCGQCVNPIEIDAKTTFLNGQKVLPFYLAGVFDLHGPNCEEIKQDAVVLGLAYTYTMNMMAKKYPNLSIKPMKDIGAFVVDTCSDSYRLRGFTVDTETSCIRLPNQDYNVTIPSGAVLGQVSALSDHSLEAEHTSLLSGLRIPSVSMSAEHSKQNGILELLPSPKMTVKALVEFLKSQQWEYVTVIVSSERSKQQSLYEEFIEIANGNGICIDNVIYIAQHNRTQIPLQHNTNVTLFFTTSIDAADYVSNSLRYNEVNNNVNVMVGEALDFYLHNPVNAVHFTGTVAIRPKDILPSDFVDFLKEVTPLNLPEPWFWNFVEKRWRCALHRHNKDLYEGRMCTGDELLNVAELGRMTDAGYLINGVQTLVFAVNEAFNRICGRSSNGFCTDFMEKSRELMRRLLDSEDMHMEFEVDEFLPLDHHGNLGYRQIGNFTKDFKYTPVSNYKLYISSVLKADAMHTSLCLAPICACKRVVIPQSSHFTEKITSSINWIHTKNVDFFANFDANPLNYIFLGITATLSLCTASVLLLIIYKVYTKVIKGNQSLGIFTLTGIILLNFTAFLLILDSKNMILDLRNFMHALAHVICFGVILLKAICLRNAEDLNAKHQQQIGYWNYWVTLLFVIAVQVAISTKRLTDYHYNVVVTQSYVGFLAVFALFSNIRNRRIRRNYKESKWLSIASLVALVVFSTWIVVKICLPTFESREVDILEITLMSATLLIFLFGPKVYILLFYEPLVVERSVTPAKEPYYEDDLFEQDMSIAASMHSIPQQLSQVSSPSMNHDDEFPAFKTVMRKKDFNGRRSNRNSNCSDYNSNASTASPSQPH